MIKTEITRMLGIQYPLFQGGMAWVADAKLAAAVSNAGGLGLIGASAAPGEVVEGMIREAKSLTDKPFGVNVMLMSPFADDVARICAEQGYCWTVRRADSGDKLQPCRRLPYGEGPRGE